MCSGLNWEGHIRLQLGAPCVFKSELTLGCSRQIGNFESDARFSAGDACICDLTRALGLDLQICTKKAVESNHRVLPRNESRRLETSDLRRTHRVRRRRKFFRRILCYSERPQADTSNAASDELRTRPIMNQESRFPTACRKALPAFTL